MNEQRRNITRVAEKIRVCVRDFFRAKGSGADFTITELTKYVASKVAAAPDSPARIMRALRARGDIYYIVISRSQSRYRITGPAQQELF